jgi:hypothetical protein
MRIFEPKRRKEGEEENCTKKSLIILLFTKYYYDDQFKGIEICGEYSMHGRDVKFWPT